MASSFDYSDENILCPRARIHRLAILEVVKNNSVDLLESALAFFTELQIMDGLSQCNDEGETLLVIAMKGKNLYFIEKLMHVWIKCVCSFNQSHLMSLVDQLSHHIPIVELIGYLIVNIRDVEWLQCLGLHFIQSTSFTRQDQIVALELIGAASTFVSPFEGYYDTRFALKCWRQAMNLRFLPADGESVPKTTAECVSSVSSAVVFGSTIEVMTIEEFDLLEEDRETLYFNGVNAVVIQALLVIRRYSSQNNLGHPYWLYLRSLMMFAEMFKEGFEMHETLSESKLLVNIYLLILEQLNGFDPKLLPRKIFDVFASAIHCLSKHYCEIIDDSLDSPAREELNYKNLLAPTEFIATMSKFFSNPAMISSVEFYYYLHQFEHFSFAEIIYRFLVVLDEISPQMSKQENQKLEEYYSNYLQNFFAHQTSTILHMVIDPFSILVFKQVNVNIIKLILKLGANPNAVDKYGQTPLHILAGDRYLLMQESEWFVPIFRALVDADAHLDTATYYGATVISILKKNLLSLKQSGQIAHPYFESVVNTVFRLNCYCARVIRRHGIPVNRLPSHLQSFVEMHSNVEGKHFLNQHISFCL